MRPYQTTSLTLRISVVLFILLFLTGCEFFNNLMNGETSKEQSTQTTQLRFGVAPQVPWMPWFLANQEGTFERLQDKYTIQVEFVPDNYQATIEKFVNREVDAMVITNIDAIAQLVRRDIEADVILITARSNGNEAILLPANANSEDIQGYKFALIEYSTRHYLLDRYLIKQQIPFDEVSVLNTPEGDYIRKAFADKKVEGVVTTHPVQYDLVSKNNAKILFDSRDIPGEIVDFLVVNREVLEEHPEFAHILLETWFSVMEKVLTRSGSAFDAMADLAGVSRQAFEKQFSATTILADTPIRALSVMRATYDMKKNMRHIRYFIERHDLTGPATFSEWLSYPGRSPALLHLNAVPLKDYQP